MATDAEVTVESSPTDVLKSLTPAQHKTWRATGEIPESKSPPAEPQKEAPKESTTDGASSAPAKKETTEPAAAKPAAETVAEPVPAKPEPKAKGAEARIKELLSENKRLTAELEATKAKPVAAPAKTEEPAKPHRTDVDSKTGQLMYATDEAFEAAHEKYLREQISRDVRKEIAKEQEAARVEEQNRIIGKRFENSLKIAKERHKDFLDVVQAKEVEKDGKKTTTFEAPGIKAIKTNGVLDAWLLDSAEGSELVYYFATRPEEVERIQALNPFEISRELTKLEIKLATPEPAKEEKPAEGSTATSSKPVKVPPEPASSVGGKATAPVDEELAAVEAGDFRRYKETANQADWRKKKAS